MAQHALKNQKPTCAPNDRSTLVKNLVKQKLILQSKRTQIDDPLDLTSGAKISPKTVHGMGPQPILKVTM